MLIFGIDVGTTGTKAAIIDEKGCVLGKGYQEYSLITTPEGGTECRGLVGRNGLCRSDGNKKRGGFSGRYCGGFFFHAGRNNGGR